MSICKSESVFVKASTFFHQDLVIDIKLLLSIHLIYFQFLSGFLIIKYIKNTFTLVVQSHTFAATNLFSEKWA